MTIRWLTPAWPVPRTVRALSTLRAGGVSGVRYATLNLGAHVGDAADAVAENRRRLREAAALPGEPVWLTQVHGVAIADLDRPDPAGAAQPTADGAFTRHPGRICAILTADCLPVLLAASSGAAVGAAHAGWRGLADGVIEAAVRALALPPASLLAWLGPGIGPRHFEVGPEVREALLAGDPGAGECFERNPRGRYLANLPALARRRLERLGVTEVYEAGECTHERSERYFSHRRDGATGRQATLVWLAADAPPGA